MEDSNTNDQIGTQAPLSSTPTAADLPTAKLGRLRRPFLLLLVALVVAVLLDLLLAQEKWGWHWALTLNLFLAAVLVGAKLEGSRIPLPSLTLMVLISLSALLTGFRAASFTTAALMIFSSFGMLLLTVSLLNGQWMRFRLREYFLELIKIIPSAVVGTPSLFFEGFRSAQSATEANPKRGRRALAVLRGVLLTIPLLLIFGALLASADSIFSDMLGSAFDWIKFDLPDDLFSHVGNVLLLTWFGAAALWHALARSSRQLEIEPDKPLIQPFLGMTEAMIVLVSLNLLFATFLLVQFRYFFAGSANVHINGFTFAEYARRGFFELVAVALIASLLYFSLASITKRSEQPKKRLFSLFAGLLLAQVGVMLVSAFQRLRLYEQAYGYTSSRLAAHVFMIFIGLMLLALLIMEIRNSFRRLGLVLVMGMLAFALVMVGINEDALIADRNIDRALQGEEMDAQYLLYYLTDNAVPTLFRYMDSPDLTPELQSKLQTVMACRYAAFVGMNSGTRWQSITIPTVIAGRLYEQHRAVLEQIPLTTNDRGEKEVEIDGINVSCTSYRGF